MNVKRCFFVAILVLLALGLTAGDAGAGKKKNKKSGLDEGRLDPSWFGDDLEFHRTEEIDYLWVKEGFSLEGRSLHFEEWPDPEFLGEDADDRDEDDENLARRMNRDMPELFMDAFEVAFDDKITASLTEGDVIVSGRIVDCSTGSVAAKAFWGMGAGAGNTTIDVKFVDKESGELLAGFHHRVVSGTNWSTTDSKFTKWAGKAAVEIAEEGFYQLYEEGKRAKE